MLTKTVLSLGRMKYFLQVNRLYRVEEQKLRVNDSNVVAGKIKFNIVLKISWKKKNGMAMLTDCLESDGSNLGHV